MHLQRLRLSVLFIWNGRNSQCHTKWRFSEEVELDLRLVTYGSDYARMREGPSRMFSITLVPSLIRTLGISWIYFSILPTPMKVLQVLALSATLIIVKFPFLSAMRENVGLVVLAMFRLPLKAYSICHGEVPCKAYEIRSPTQ